MLISLVSYCGQKCSLSAIFWHFNSLVHYFPIQNSMLDDAKVRQLGNDFDFGESVSNFSDYWSIKIASFAIFPLWNKSDSNGCKICNLYIWVYLAAEYWCLTLVPLRLYIVNIKNGSCKLFKWKYNLMY